MSTEKTRNWATIVYPESAPENWRDILRELHIPAIISPLHDDDVDTDTGEIKKAHYHVILLFDNTKTEKYANEIASYFGGIRTKRVHSIKAYTRYLTHMDDPDKAQYSQDDIECFSGASYLEILETDEEIALDIMAQMEDFIDDNKIESLAEFQAYCRKNNRDWYRLLHKKHADFWRYIHSRYWTSRKGGEYK